MKQVRSRRSKLFLGGFAVFLALGASVAWASTVERHDHIWRHASEVFNNPAGTMLIVADDHGNSLYISDGVIAFGKKKGPGPAPQPPNPSGLCGGDTMVGGCETSEYSRECTTSDGEQGMQWCSQVSCRCLGDSGSYTSTAQGGCGSCAVVALDGPAQTLAQ